MRLTITLFSTTARRDCYFLQVPALAEFSPNNPGVDNQLQRLRAEVKTFDSNEKGTYIMTAQQSVVAAPALKEAENGVLFIHKLSDPTSAVVPPSANAQVGDVIELTTNTSTDNQWKDQTVLTSAIIGKPVEFAIPKGTFAQNLVAGATAKVNYIIIPVSGNITHSPDLLVRLEP